MPTNLHALIRYRTLDRCFRDLEYNYHWQDLAKACEEELYFQMGVDRKLSRRTIMYDIKNMKSGKLGYEAPIEYDRKEGYFYSIPNFSIHQVPLNKSDLDELNTALTILKQFSGNEQITGIEHVLQKLEQRLNLRHRKRNDSVIQFEHSLNEPGQRWVNVLYEHIKANQALTIGYQPFGKELKHIVMSPYLLKEYDNRWFIIGYGEDYDGVITLGLDRIQTIQPSLKTYHIADTFNAKEWFEDIIGVSKHRDRQKTTIEFKVYGVQINYLNTKPIHPSQQVISSEGEVHTFSICVIPNYEVISQFLSFGESVEIISPSYIRDELVERLTKTIAHYR